MVTTLTIDKAGRVVLPKPVREELELRAGDSLELESSEEGIVLRPARAPARMRRKRGVWVVMDSGKPLPANMVRETLDKVRQEREKQILGKWR
jgi:AbrB family looped-hinge helix DNA binding protein